MKKILGLDLGPNSIGWAVVKATTNENNELFYTNIEAAGCRIIPMDAATLGDFDKGNTISQTGERTKSRSMRRLQERHVQRRERLLRVLNILGFLPEHFAVQIDRYGKFTNENEPKIAWKKHDNNQWEFLFMDSFMEMLDDFRNQQPELVSDNKKVPYDWTIYYLRKKALIEKISKQELAWILLSFNQKRGYFQLRGEEETNDDSISIITSKILEVNKKEKDTKSNKYWYEVILKNGRCYKATFFNDISFWQGTTRDFLLKTKKMKDGNVKEEISYMPTFDEIETMSEEQKNKMYAKIKLKTEKTIDDSGKTVGSYIYEYLLKMPEQKIRGKLIRTIERKFYREELRLILKKQLEYHPELSDCQLYEKCLYALYESNDAFRNSISNRDFCYLLIDNIIFYQRPLKSKKSLIGNCSYEERGYIHPKTKEYISVPIKCIAKSHPIFQEFRLWQFISNLRIYEIEKDIDVTHEFLPNAEEYENLYTWLNDRSNGKINQKDLFATYFNLAKKKGAELAYRWNYVEDKDYPCNEIRSTLLKYLSAAQIKNGTQVLETIGHDIYQSEINALKRTLDKTYDAKKKEEILSLLKDKEKSYQLAQHNTLFIQQKAEEALWHILYSIDTKTELKKGLQKFAERHHLPENFVSVFMTIPPFKKEYGSYSEKAIKRLLPLMRMGKYWDKAQIDDATQKRIEKIISGECDESIKIRVREKAMNLNEIKCYQALPLWLACYIVYDRHSESKEICKWHKPEDIDQYLKTFKQHSLRNPIVEKITLETLRVVRDVWKQVGQIDEIHLELARNLKEPAENRRKITQNILKNESRNIRIKAMLMEFADPVYNIDNVISTSPSQFEILKIYEDTVLSNASSLPEDISDMLKKWSDSQKIPGKNELLRYKLWLEQQYRSPYTGRNIPLGKLFTSEYEIEHIIPQSRYFDNSYSNKVICESSVNRLKDRQLGYEFIRNHHGEIVGDNIKILSIEEYEKLVKENYSCNPAKMKKLLLEDIPDDFIERQLNDTRYISKLIKSLLSNIVREEINGEYEQEATSKNLIVCSGGVTDYLKKDWGVNDVWNRIILPRFERMNRLTNSNDYTTINKSGHTIPCVPFELQKGFNKKRIDHRHHAMDAIVIACCTREHVNLINNEAAKSKNVANRYQLSRKLRRYEKTVINGKEREVAKEFIKPWENFTTDVQKSLENIIVSFKQNLRVITKSNNHYLRFVDGKKTICKQDGRNLAIRKPLHEDTVYGEVNLRRIKEVKLSTALACLERIVEKDLKHKLIELVQLNYTEQQIKTYLIDNKETWNDINPDKIKVYYFTKEAKDRFFATRIPINKDFNEEKIKSKITDSGIQKILLAHLANNNNDPTIAFSPEGIEEMNRNIFRLNENKPHKPIRKIRKYEKADNKYAVGKKENRNRKFVEAAKGTNLYFGIYQKGDGTRTFDTIPLNIVIERQKQGFKSIPERNKENDELLFGLSPNDLVYVPTKEEIENKQIEKIDKSRIYKIVSFTDNRLYAIPHRTSSVIVNKVEFKKLNKIELTDDGISIKEFCMPIKIDRLGNMSFYTI